MSLPKQSILYDIASQSKDAIIATTYANDQIVAGTGFTVNTVTSLSTGISLNILIDPTSVTPPSSTPNFEFYSLPILLKAQDQYVLISVYEDSGYEGGSSTTLSIFNRNRTSSKTFQSTITTNSTDSGDGKGTLLFQRTAFGSSTKEAIIADAGGDEIIFILDESKKYLIEFDNKGDTATNVEVNIQMYELFTQA